MWQTKAKPGTKYLCSIYKERPSPCVGYPWNHANQIFPECIFYDAENERLRTPDEQSLINTEEEISDYCVSCGRCCHFGPAACSMLQVVTIEEPEKEKKKSLSGMSTWMEAVSKQVEDNDKE